MPTSTGRGPTPLLDYLENKSDFFTSPASARYHGAYVGGLCEHSVNVYHCLREYLARERVQELYGVEAPDESVAVSALLHDLCKTGCYKAGSRNVKGPDGKWTAVPTFFYEDKLPYGHGEKSVYIISGFMKLTRPGGHGHPVAHGLFRRGGQPPGGPGPAAVSPGLRPLGGRHGGHLFSGEQRTGSPPPGKH